MNERYPCLDDVPPPQGPNVPRSLRIRSAFTIGQAGAVYPQSVEGGETDVEDIKRGLWAVREGCLAGISPTCVVIASPHPPRHRLGLLPGSHPARLTRQEAAHVRAHSTPPAQPPSAVSHRLYRAASYMRYYCVRRSIMLSNITDASHTSLPSSPYLAYCLPLADRVDALRIARGISDAETHPHFGVPACPSPIIGPVGSRIQYPDIPTVPTVRVWQRHDSVFDASVDRNPGADPVVVQICSMVNGVVFRYVTRTQPPDFPVCVSL